MIWWNWNMKHLSKNILASGAILLSRASKLLPANVSPLGSFGFFGSQPIWFFLSIILFDRFFGGSYDSALWTYLAFASYPVLGYLARKSQARQIRLLPLASLLFFLISNFGVWLNWYPNTLSGLMQCYVLALPFYWRTLIGDLVFGYGFLAWKKYGKKIIPSFYPISPVSNP